MTDQPTAPTEQGTHFFHLTLAANGGRITSHVGHITPQPGQTRLDIYQELYSLITREPGNGGSIVTNFTVEPNQL
jgi:hypothetical protein